MRDRIPTALADRMLASWHDVRWGEMVIHLECRFDGALDVERLARACELAVAAEPVLGCRLAPGRFGRWWKPVPGAGAAVLEVTRDPGRWEQLPRQALDPRREPQLKALLLREAAGDRLLFRVSHVAADARGTKDAVATVSRIYRRLGEDARYVPEPNARGSRSLRQVSRALPWRALARGAVNLLRIAAQNRTPVHRVDLPLGPREPFTWVHRGLDGPRVRSLAEWGKARAASLNDVVIAAFLWAIAAATAHEGTAHHRLQMTVDLRRYLDGGVAGGICNLSAFDYVELGTGPLGSFGEAVDEVARATAQRKRDWLGIVELVTGPLLFPLPIGALGRLFKAILERGHRNRTGANGLTNMGPIAPAVVDFDLLPRTARLLTPVIYPPLFACGMSGYAGSLELNCGVPVSAQPAAAAFLDAVITTLVKDLQPAG